MSRTNRRSERRALRIPGAEGYHYADDHPWDDEKQQKVTDMLWDIVRDFGGSAPEKAQVPPENQDPPRADVPPQRHDDGNDEQS